MNRADWLTVRTLHQQGLSIRAIARRLGLHRRSVREVLQRREGAAPLAPAALDAG